MPRIADFQLAGVPLFRSLIFRRQRVTPFGSDIDPSKAAAIAAVGVTRCEIKAATADRIGSADRCRGPIRWPCTEMAVTRLQALLRIVHEAETGPVTGLCQSRRVGRDRSFLGTIAGQRATA